MPKTKNAFALRGFDVEEYLRIKLLEYGLKKNALDNLDADLDALTTAEASALIDRLN